MPHFIVNLTSLRLEKASCTVDADLREGDRRLYFKILEIAETTKGGEEERSRRKTKQHRTEGSVM